MLGCCLPSVDNRSRRKESRGWNSPWDWQGLKADEVRDCKAFVQGAIGGLSLHKIR